MKRRELVWGSGTRAKFWNVEVRGSALTVHFGRVGTTGQRRDKELADDGAARKEAERLIREKLGKGYAEASASLEARAKRAGAKATAGTVKADAKTAARPSQGGAGGPAGQIRQAWAMFEQRPDLFELQSHLEPPASASALAETEKRIGAALPETLRDLYRNLGDGARFHWSPKASAVGAFGVEDAVESRGGSFELLPLVSLRRIDDSEAWLFSNDGSGDGFAVDYATKRPRVAWHTHDDEPVTEHADDFPRWFHDLVAAGFTDVDDPLNGVVKRWLAGRRELAHIAAPIAPMAADKGARVKPFAPFPKLRGPARAVVMLPDGRVAIGCDSGGVRLFDVRSGKALGSFRSSLVLSLRASPSGRYLAARCMNGMHVWDLTSGVAHASRDEPADVVFVDDETLIGLRDGWSYRYSVSLERKERLDLPAHVRGAERLGPGELWVYGHDREDRPQVSVHDLQSLAKKHGCHLDGITSISRGSVAFAGDVAIAGRGDGSVGKWRGGLCIQQPTGGDAGKYVEYTVKWELGPVAYDAASDRLYAGYTALEDDGTRYPALRCIAATSGTALWDRRIAAPLWAIALTPDAKRLVATTADARAYAADVDYVAEHGLS